MLTIAELLAFQYRRTQSRLLKSVDDLGDADPRRQWPHANSIGFDAWHSARWADHLQMLLPRMTEELRSRLGAREQIWVEGDLARAWGDPVDKLGAVGRMGMDESLAASLPLPEKATLVDYIRRAFVASSEAVAALRDDDLMRKGTIADADAPSLGGEPEKGPVMNWVLAYDEHANRHLGMIEARRGLRGMRGTATA